MVKHLSDKNEVLSLISNSPRLLLDFHATWCGPCKMLTPLVEQLAEEHPEIEVIAVDVDKSPELAALYEVFSVPTLVYFENGEKIRQQAGYRPYPSLLNFVNL